MIKKLLLVLTLLISSALIASPALAAPGAPGPADPPGKQNAPGQQTAPGLQNAPGQQPAPAPQGRPATPPGQQQAPGQSSSAPGQQKAPGQPATPYAPGQQKAPGQPATPYAPGQQDQAPPVAAAPEVAQAPDRVEICHANNGNGYNAITVSSRSITNGRGHAGHDGDIIPPFEGFGGSNWDAAGQAIYAAGCDADAQPGANPNANAKVTLCHANNGRFGYSLITVSINSVIKGAGHDGHDGDIIPPFEYEGGSYAGKNWTAGREPLTSRADCLTGGSVVDSAAVTAPPADTRVDSAAVTAPLVDTLVDSGAVLRPTSSGSSDSDRDGFLPSTGGAALWLLVLGVLATLAGLVALRARRSTITTPGAAE